MKKYLTAGLLATCLTLPAFAANSQLRGGSPDEPLNRRTVALCIAVCVALHAYKRRMTCDEQAMTAYLR